MTSADADRATLKAITPRIPAKDMAASIHYYCEKLGFDLGWKWGNPTSHANVCRDQISIDLFSFTHGASPAMAYIQVSGVDTYYSELTQRGTEVSRLADKPYGMRDFEVINPSGNRIAFGEPIHV